MSIPYTSQVSMFQVNPSDSGVITQTTTSGAVDVSKRQLLSIQFLAASVSAGNGSFQVQVSNDGINFVNYGSAVVLSSNTSSFFFKTNAQDYFRLIRVVCTVTTDGSYSALLEAGG